MFCTKEDIEEWKSQIVISNFIKMGLQKHNVPDTMYMNNNQNPLQIQ